MSRIFIMKGEGIECEKESARFFGKSRSFDKVEEFVIPKVASGEGNPLKSANKGDWLFIPGGFAFADHFGAGRLLAHRLHEMGVFSLAQEKGMHVMGVCNGFQMLVAAGIFGKNLRLLDNRAQGRRLGFINRWTSLRTSKFLGEEDFSLPVRHGEGRLFVDSDSCFLDGVEPFLTYTEEKFENGSRDRIAGLHVLRGQSHFWGMMPHPEIAMTSLSHPNVVGAEYFDRFRGRTREFQGDGFRLWKAILNFSEGVSSHHA